MWSLVWGWLATGVCLGHAPSRPDVVLVTLDTTRADRIGVYGHAQARTPVLDRLARQGRRYARTYAPAPYTIPSHGALFTGRHPSSLGLWTNHRGLSQSETTLTEVLSGAGYHTAASVGAVVTHRMWGFGQGFDEYFDNLSDSPLGPTQRPGAHVVDDVLQWADTADRSAPWFVWVHLFDAHTPHVAPQGEPGDPYDAEIAALDVQIGRLVERFSERPTWFVVVGDHGEGLGDHGEYEHGLFVYDNTQRVPWVMSGPGIEAAVVSSPMSLIDVAPTLLDTLGLGPLPRSEGRVVHRNTDPHPVRMESAGLTMRFGLAPHRAVVVWPYKLIDVPTPELYHLERDPGEHYNLAPHEPGRVAALRSRLPPMQLPEEVHPTGQTELLAELGYVEGEVPADGPLPDAKQHRGLIRGIELADAAIRGQRWEVALEHLAAVHRRYPHIAEVVIRLARLESELGHVDAAVTRLREAYAQDPDRTTVASALAHVLAAAGRWAEAAPALERLAKTHPHLPNVHLRAMEALLRIDAVPRALEIGEARLRTEPEDVRVAGLVGVLLARRGTAERARRWLEQGARATRPVRDVHLFLARYADEAGDAAEATRHLEQELAAHPDNVAASLALALLHERSGDVSAQLRVIDAALDRIEGSPAAHQGADWLRTLQKQARQRLGAE